MKSKFLKYFETEDIFFIIGVISLFPLFVLSYFNNPTGDDYCYNLATLNSDYFLAQKDLYLNLNGRYFASAILSIPILITSSLLFYKSFPIIIFILLFYSIYNLSKTIFVKFNKKEHVLISFFCISLYLIGIPSISQGFYWLASTITYQFANVFTIFLFSFLIKLIETNKTKYLIISTFLIIAIIGSNEISLILIVFLLMMIFAFQIYNIRKINYQILFLLIIALIFAIIELNSQGNVIRATLYPNRHQFFYALYKTLVIIKSYLGIWLPYLIVFLLLFFDFFNKNIHKINSNIFKVNPIFVFLIVSSILFLSFFSNYWATGYLFPLRTINVIYLFFIMSSLYLALVIFIKLRNLNKDFITFSPIVRYCLLIILLLQFGHKNNIRTAYTDLVSKDGYNYDLALKKRYQFIENSKSRIVEVEEIKFKPKTLFIGDITKDSLDWRNDCYSSYFRKTIILKSQ